VQIDIHDATFRRTIGCENGQCIRFYKLNEPFNRGRRYTAGEEAEGIVEYSVEKGAEDIDETSFNTILQHRLGR